MNDLKKVFSFARAYRKDFAIAVALVCIETVFEMIIPLIMTDIVDVGVPAHDIPYLLLQGGKMAVCAALSLICGLGYAGFAARAAYGFGAALRQAQYEKLQEYSFSNLDRFSTSSLVTRMTTDVTVMQNAVNGGLRPLVRSPIMLGLGIAMSDELSGDLTLAFSLLKIDEESLYATFDGRCPLCANEDNVLKVVKEKLAEKHFELHTREMRPPHHVSGDSPFVKTLLAAYEQYTGQKGQCLSMGGGTYVHDLKNGVAFGASMPGTDNRMHGADEFAVIDELLTAAKIYAQVIVDLCQ